jgi:hypothetical protein
MIKTALDLLIRVEEVTSPKVVPIPNRGRGQNPRTLSHGHVRDFPRQYWSETFLSPTGCRPSLLYLSVPSELASCATDN